MMTDKRKLNRTRIISVRPIAENVYILSFKRDFEFISGQVIALDTEENGIPRLYSISSGENEENIEILFDEKPDGKLTPKLSELKSGDNLYVSEPFGRFHCADEKAWWIASGTGIAPFVSMAKSGLTKNKKLIHGGRYGENFYFQNYLDKLLGNDYIRCCTQQEDVKFYNGRLTQWLKEQKEIPADTKFYLCGSPEMVVEVRDILISKKVPFQNIISETYF